MNAHCQRYPDKKYVVLGPSVELPLAGEGLMAARDLPAGTKVALFSGRVMTLPAMDEVVEEYKRELLQERGLSVNSSEFIDTWKYNHRYWVGRK